MRSRLNKKFAAYLLAIAASSGLALVTSCRMDTYLGRDVTSASELTLLAPGVRVPVRVSGIVTFYDAQTRRGYLQDEAGAVAKFQLKWTSEFAGAGRKIVLEGTGSRDGNLNVVLANSHRDEAASSLPEAMPVEGGAIGRADLEGRLIRIGGTVESMVLDRSGWLAFEVFAQGARVDVRVRRHRQFAMESYIGGSVQLTGIARSLQGPNGLAESRQLLVADSESIVLTKRRTDPAALPLLAPEGLPSISPGERVRMTGTLVDKGNRMLVIQQGDRSVPVRFSKESSPMPGKDIEIAGFVDRTGTNIGLRNAIVLPGAGNSQRLLTTAEAIHALSPAEAGSSVPVWLKGVVTATDATIYVFFLQDHTGGVYVNLQEVPVVVARPGDTVEISGVSGMGEFAPILRARSVRVTGKGKLPRPLEATPEALFSGQLDSDFVVVEGVVHSATLRGSNTILHLRRSSSPIMAYVPGSHVADFEKLVDSRVRIRGVSGTIFNGRRQIAGIRLFVASRDLIELVEKGPDHPPLLKIAGMHQFSRQLVPGQRIAVQGVVSALEPETSTVFVQDESGGTKVALSKASDARLGDVVEVIGYPGTQNLGPVIEDAIVRKLQRREPPKHTLTTAGQVLEEMPAAELIDVEGILVEQHGVWQRPLLTLQSGSTMFQAQLPWGAAFGHDLRTGDRVRVRGICELEGEAGLAPIAHSFTVKMRSEEDIAMLERAPWLTTPRAANTLLGLALLGAMAAAWAFLLRRKVQSQTDVIRKQLEHVEKLKHLAEAASRMKTQFLANMSHEIRTPMNGILGFARLALDKASGEVRENLETITESAESLVIILNDILDFSKIEAGQMKFDDSPCALHELLKSTVSLFSMPASEKGIELKLELDARLPRQVQTDPIRLRQILTNLISNAVKFTMKGSVLCRASVVNREGRAATLLFTVMDTGTGISPERQRAIFEPFTQEDNSITRRFGGTGLGLSISGQLAKIAGGSITVESEVGSGSAFSLTLPVQVLTDCAECPEANCEVRREASRWPSGSRVLVAEDNKVNQRLIERLLTNLGSTVEVAENGRLAVEAFEQGSFDIVLMDIHMPIVDGFQATREIRNMAAHRGLRSPVIVALTADVMSETQKACELAGMDGYVAKPIHVDELIREYLLAAQRRARASKPHSCPNGDPAAPKLVMPRPMSNAGQPAETDVPAAHP